MHYKAYRSILSPRGGFNLYRGCTHGCIYCDSRSHCYHIDHEFEDIEVKQDAAVQLERELAAKRKPIMLSTGSMSDPYNPLEETLHLTRDCLSVILRRGFGVSLLTKSDRILRDMDLICSINRATKCVVQMTLTCADDGLSRLIEPNVCPTTARYRALRQFRDAGVPIVVWMDPILPFLTDTEENLRALLEMCFDVNCVGIMTFGFGVTMRDGDREYFYQALDRDFPGIKSRYVRAFGSSYECESPASPRLAEIFFGECRRHGVLTDPDEIFAYLSRFPEKAEQLSFF